MAKRIVLLKQTTERPAADDETLIVDMDSVKHWVKTRTFHHHLLHYSQAQGLTYHVETLAKPLAFALLLRLFSWGRCSIADRHGNQLRVTLGYLAKLAGEWVRDFFRQGRFLRQAEAEIRHLRTPGQELKPVQLDLVGRPVYCRTDLIFGLQSGGSVGHIAGVLNHLDAFTGKPIFLTTDQIPTVRSEIETLQIWPDHRFREYNDLRTLVFNDTFFTRASQYLRGQSIAFVYQRYSMNNYAGLQLARSLHAPFVLEYNGSEIWVSRNWGKPLTDEALAEQIELTNLHGAHLVVVVSQPLKDELIARGVAPEKILVNPNGVDVARYAPDVDGCAVRKRLGLTGKRVIGFIGTFGPWHGAEVLAAAFGRLLHAQPAYRDQVRLLMIGNGVTMPQVCALLQESGAAEYTVLTGIVPQAQGPAHLAACDILVSPHVPNPDGTRFFGSPTKLFEYMAMGKGIVASDLDQIGEILAHGQTAWLVAPGDVDALAAGMRHLLDDPALAERMGAAARHEVVQRYTWRAHTQRIIEALAERMTDEKR
jgi:glycosyltransferase involved in cell wall biosynthesis